MNKKTLEYLILEELVEVAAYDEEHGDFLYQFTDKAITMAKRFSEKYKTQFYREVLYFWEHGFLDIDNLEDPDPLIRLTPKAFDDDELDQLLPEIRVSLEVIKKALA